MLFLHSIPFLWQLENHNSDHLLRGRKASSQQRTMTYQLLFTSLLLLTSFPVSQGFWSTNSGSEEKQAQQPDEPVEYGVDVSFPIHYASVSTNYEWLPHNQDPSLETPKMYEDMPIQPLGDRQEFYRDFLQGCRDAFGKKGNRCTQTEIDRVAMSLRQPQSMTNYTDVGFKKIRAPESVWKLIKEFWDKNQDKQVEENWGVGNTYTNNWKAKSYMVSVEDTHLRGGGRSLKQHIWDAARTTIQEWTGQELTECSLYGIRVYTTDAVLATHVDRLPLVSSAIINVAQDVDEPWPLEVYTHDGKAVNVTMEPGDMVLYESHSVLHGRPFPLKGRYMANIFIHFEPTGHTLRHNAKQEAQAANDVHAQYRDALARGAGGHEVDEPGLPKYIMPGTPEAQRWTQQHPGNRRSKRNSATTGTEQTIAHLAAQEGNVKELHSAVEENSHLVKAKDENGWTPLHEGARAGHVDVVKLLIEKGADLNDKTEGGGTALYWAKHELEPEHPMIAYLESLGALDNGPDL
eukprot:Nitzschia sp. Nitz4//scaffold58_size112336//60326//62043//NITZ4_004037-RA/size112336-augustus-gene-0.8-mRNA-1//1//CDS//3329555001//1023//frame0